MNDLMLKIRAQVLKSNVEKVREIAKEPNMERRYEEIQKSSEVIATALREHNRNLSGLSEELLETAFGKDIVSASQAAQNILVSFLGLRDCVTKLIKGATRTVPVRTPEPAVSGLDAILQQLNQGNRQQAWRLYSTEYPAAKRLLSEYLEFMGGWALRDAGLDQGICNLADELLPVFNRSYSGVTYNPVTIPARQETARITWARILRMGSPEWGTIWALPLIAHDIWFAMAQEIVQAQEKLEDIDVTAPWIQECLADAYAIWATGPAYAYALFFLRLDPFHAWEGDNDHAGDGERAAAVLHMWKLMGRKDRQNDPYRNYLQDLTDEWREALRAANPPGKPQKERLRLIAKPVHILFNKLYAGYAIDDWNRIQEWPKALCEGKADSIKLEGTFAGLHWVLNAAWLARIERPDDFRDIGEQARLLWNRVGKLSTQKTPQPALEGLQSRALAQSARRG